MRAPATRRARRCRCPTRSPSAVSTAAGRAPRASATMASRQRMLAALIEAGGECAAPRSSLNPACGDDRAERRPAHGQRAGLVDDQACRSCASARSLRHRVNSTPGCRRAAGRDHDRHRRGQSQRARTGDDQHGDRIDQCHRPSEGSGPNSPQTKKVAARRRRPQARTSTSTASASRCIGARERCAGRDHLHDLRQHGFRADLLGAHDQAAGAVDASRRSPRRRRAFSTGNGSPVSIDSSTLERPSSTTPSTGTFSPGRTRRRSPTAREPAARPLQCRRRADAAPSSAPAPAAP